MSTATRKKRSAALDKIVIRRPVPSPEVLQDAEPAIKPPVVVNPEFEQKPLAELNLQTSEDFHGGSELTFSMPSQQGRGGRDQRNKVGGGSGQQEGGGAEADSRDVRQRGAGETQRRESAEQSQGPDQRQDGVGHPPHGEDAESLRRDQQTAEGGGEPHQPTPGGQESGGGDASQQRSASGDARGDSQQKSDSEEGGVERQPQQQGAQQQVDASAQRQEDLRRWEEGASSAEERGDARQFGAGTQAGFGAFNTAQVVDVAEGPRTSDLKRLQTEFYRILEMLAEEKTKQFDPSLVGSLVKAEYNVKKMALRRYEGKPPTKYKAPRVREAVVLVLDNSGSMYVWTDMLRAMAELAAKRRDVEVYLAPNGYVEEQIAPVRRKVSHDEFMKKMSGRKIIYVGDFDGANTPIKLSWRNEVVWIAPESRYRRFRSHNWVEYDESKFKGAFIRAFTIDDVMKGLRKVLGGAKWIDMCKRCEDE